MSKSRSATPTLTRKQHSRAERDRTLQRQIVIGTIVVAVLVVGVIIYGIVDQTILAPLRPVARVNADSINVATFQKAVRYTRFQILGNYVQTSNQAQLFASDAQFKAYFDNQLQQLQSQLDDTEGLGRQVLNSLIEDRLIRQEAARRGITVSQAELDARMQETFGYFVNGTPTPTITPTPFPTDVIPPTATFDPAQVALWTPTPTVTPTATFEPTATATPGPSATPAPTSTPRPTATPLTIDGYNQRVTSYTADLTKFATLNEADMRVFVEAELYRQKVYDAVTAGVHTSEEQVLARHILVPDQATALAILAKYQAGQDWAQLAKEFSTDTATKDSGGLLSWFPKDGQMVAEFATAAFSTTVGSVSEPVQSQYGWHLIQVLDRQNRALTASELSSKRDTAFQAWLQAQRDAAGDKVKILDGWQNNVPTSPSLADLQKP